MDSSNFSNFQRIKKRRRRKKGKGNSILFQFPRTSSSVQRGTGAKRSTKHKRPIKRHSPFRNSIHQAVRSGATSCLLSPNSHNPAKKSDRTGQHRTRFAFYPIPLITVRGQVSRYRARLEKLGVPNSFYHLCLLFDTRRPTLPQERREEGNEEKKGTLPLIQTACLSLS